MIQGATKATDGYRHGETTPSAGVDGVIHLRRRTDWTGDPRAGDEAATSAYQAALNVATATLAAHDGGTASHSDDVVTLCLALAAELGIEGRERAYLLAAAELHDIGKVGVPAQILSKPGPLDAGEWNVVRGHTVTGERILGSAPELAEVARIVRHCHERWDGGGYPDSLAGEEIPLAARVVFCADAYHAIRDDRPYRPGRSASAALAEVERHAGSQFDPAVVEALARVSRSLRGRRGFGGALGGRRSQRLAALLLALTIGGGALAATGIWSAYRGKASTDSQGRAQPPGPSADHDRSARDRRSPRPAREVPTRGVPSRGSAEAAKRKSADTPSAGRSRAEAEGARQPKPGDQGQAGLQAPEQFRSGRSPSRPVQPPRRTSAPAGGPTPTPGPVQRPRKPRRVATKPRRVTPPRVVPAPVPTPPPGVRGDDDDGDDDHGDSGNHYGHERGKGHQKDRGGHRGHDH